MSLIDAAEIKVRCDALRLKTKELAQLADRHPHTVVNLLQGKSTRSDTLSAVNRVLVQEELKLRDHLSALYPVTQGAAE